MLNLPSAAPRGPRRNANGAWRMPRRFADPEAALVAALRVLLHRYGHACNLLVGGRPRAPGLDPATRLGDLTGPVPEGLLDRALPTIAVGGGDADLAFSLSGDAVRLSYDAAVYDEATVAQLCAHLGLVLTGPQDEPVATVPILTAEERRLLLEDFNGETISYPPDLLLHDLVAAQAARTPEAIALELGDETLSYLELERRAGRAAHRLAALGAGPAAPVAVRAARTLDLFAVVLGIFKAGAPFLFLDPDDAPARHAVACEISRPCAVLGDDDVAGVAQGADVGPLRPTGVTAEDTAYILFTSGSTGAPKGVMRSHRMCATRILWEQRLYGFGAGERHLLKSPISFREFVWPLATGGTAVIAEPGGERDDRYLARLLRRGRVSVVSFVPSMLRVLLDAPGIRDAASLRHVFSGGEALSPELEQRLRRELGVEVHNTYTLTEADYVCTRRGESGHTGTASIIGRPTDMRVYLCDDARQLVPIGVPGEIYTGGPGLASGYVGRPDLTAERFLHDPVAGPPARVFRTGDLARFRDDGQLEILGRVDHQVKVRGLRVEPAEVELRLRARPGVRDAAVVGALDEAQGSRLVAYVVAAAEPPSQAELRRALAAELPAHMVPSAFVVLDRLPQLASGKLDRSALPAPTQHRPDLDVPYAAPRTERERALVQAWEGVLGVEGIGVDDDFVALGGDSLLLLTLRAAIEHRLGRPVEVGTLVACSTVAGLAEALDGGEAPGDDGDRRRRLAQEQRRRRAGVRG